VQFCDLSGVPREFATDSQRILPGDGDYQLGPIVDQLSRIGYAGAVSLEVMNPQLWPIAPQQVGEVGLTALRMALKQASGGA
jgi:sugar phosphate isomerase/epimerase